jgi:hypothetical protein
MSSLVVFCVGPSRPNCPLSMRVLAIVSDFFAETGGLNDYSAVRER